jgi:hypothetical protein
MKGTPKGILDVVEMAVSQNLMYQRRFLAATARMILKEVYLQNAGFELVLHVLINSCKIVCFC